MVSQVILNKKLLLMKCMVIVNAVHTIRCFKFWKELGKDFISGVSRVAQLGIIPGCYIRVADSLNERFLDSFQLLYCGGLSPEQFYTGIARGYLLQQFVCVRLTQSLQWFKSLQS